MRHLRCRTITATFICVALPLASSLARADNRGEPAVIVGADAPRLEQFAARQLCHYLGKLFLVDVRPTNDPATSHSVCLIVGTPDSNPAVSKALGARGWPELSDQGIVLKRGELSGKPVLVIGGGSPVATLWAAYELVERWGVRYLVDRDVFPTTRAWPGMPNLDVVMEPNMRIRCWRLVNELPMGPVSWSLEENIRFLRQIAKMKYNRIHTALWPQQPFVHYTFRGMPKPPGRLYFGQQHVIGADMIGREKYAGMTVFTNPELIGALEPEEVHRRAVELVRGIHQEAQRLGMMTGVTFNPFSWPQEFRAVMPAAQSVDQVGGFTLQPGNEQSLTDPLLSEMVATVVRAYIETYPDIDFIQLTVPEHGKWSSQGREAYRQLEQRYGLDDLDSYDELCARARSRTSFPGGGERLETQVKSDLASLWLLDSAVRVGDLLKRPGGGTDVRLIYDSITAELFPLVARITPTGGEVVNNIDYTASRVLRQRRLLRTITTKDLPVSLTLTLADDNVGVLPQLATGSIDELMKDLRTHGWAGFYTRYWTVGEQDPTVHYLSRASWDASITPERAYRDQVGQICGAAAIEPVLKSFELIEQITRRLDDHGLGFGFPVPSIMTKHYDAGGLTDEVKQDRQIYREALVLMQTGRRHCRPEGCAYLDYFVNRLRFAVLFLDAADAFGATSVSEKANQKDKARQHADAAYTAIRQALQAYADIAKDHGDLGAIAMMNSYCYRPIRDKRNELRQMASSE